MNSELQDVHRVHEGKFNTASGLKMDLNNPRPDLITLSDISIGLANTCRFGGQLPNCRYYSVAQHSVLVALMAPKHLRMAALFHDAPEAYLGDVIKPLKVMLGKKYEELEADFEAAIAQKFGISPLDFEEVKPYDKQALEVEFEWLFRDGFSASKFIEQQIKLEYPELHKQCPGLFDPCANFRPVQTMTLFEEMYSTIKKEIS